MSNRIHFTTTLDKNLLEQLKTEAIKNRVKVNDILELLIEAYFTMQKHSSINEVLKCKKHFSEDNIANFFKKQLKKSKDLYPTHLT